MKVYLAGPINGCCDHEAAAWRTEMERELDATINPLRRDYRGRETHSIKELVEADKADIEAADVVLAYCPKPSAGTSMEVYLGWSLNKKVIVVVPTGPVSPWLQYHATRVVPSLFGAVLAIRDWESAAPSSA